MFKEDILDTTTHATIVLLAFSLLTSRNDNFSVEDVIVLLSASTEIDRIAFFIHVPVCRRCGESRIGFWICWDLAVYNMSKNGCL